MVVKIRLARFGKRHAPVYNIVVAQARSARDSRPMEVLGTYNPIPRVPLASNDPLPPSVSATTGPEQAQSEVPPPRPKRYKDIALDISRTKYWLGVGAQPSEPVWRLLSLMGLMEPNPKTKGSQKESM